MASGVLWWLYLNPSYMECQQTRRSALLKNRFGGNYRVSNYSTQPLSSVGSITRGHHRAIDASWQLVSWNKFLIRVRLWSPGVVLKTGHLSLRAEIPLKLRRRPPARVHRDAANVGSQPSHALFLKATAVLADTTTSFLSSQSKLHSSLTVLKIEALPCRGRPGLIREVRQRLPALSSRRSSRPPALSSHSMGRVFPMTLMTHRSSQGKYTLNLQGTLQAMRSEHFFPFCLVFPSLVTFPRVQIRERIPDTFLDRH